MDGLEKYSQEDIEEIYDLVQSQLQDSGICRTLNYIEMTKYTISFWKQYQRDREMEVNPNPEILTEEEKQLIKDRNLNEEFFKDMKMMSGLTLTKKMSEEEENSLKEDSESFEKYWEIVGNDKSIQNLLIQSVEKIDYDEESTKSRIQNIKCILSVLNILNLDEENEKDNDEQYIRWNELYETIIDKLAELNFEDFILVYQNTENYYDMMFNKKVKGMLIKKITDMDIAQFAYFLLSLDEMVVNLDEEVWKTCIERIKREDSALLNSVYDFIHNATEKEEIKSFNMLDKVQSLHQKRFDGMLNVRKYFEMNFEERRKFEKELPQSESFKKYLKVLSELTPKEFVRYMLYNRAYFVPYPVRDNNKLTDITPEEENVFTKKIQELSNKDVMVLLERFYFAKEYKNDNIGIWDKNINNIKNCQIPEVVEKLKCFYSSYTYLILKEALKRKLVTQELEPKYSNEEENIQDEFWTYEDINETSLLEICPNDLNFYFERDETGENFEDEEQDESEYQQAMQDFEDDLEEKFELADEKIKNGLKIFEGMHKVSCISDADFCKMVNYYNNKIEESKLDETQFPLIYYIKRRIISLPTKFAHFLEYKERGCLNDAIELKAKELEAMRFFDTNDEKEI